MKKLLLVVFCCWFFIHAQAQKQGQARIDSLMELLPLAKEDTNKVLILNDICFFNFGVNPDNGIKYGKQGLELALKAVRHLPIGFWAFAIGQKVTTPKHLSTIMNPWLFIRRCMIEAG
ncbi:MAG: hypothetical protein NTX03_04755 [Bacteroidetes bacterium]|nr:hypothetical protein [Bacteroidota bacterium]